MRAICELRPGYTLVDNDGVLSYSTDAATQWGSSQDGVRSLYDYIKSLGLDDGVDFVTFSLYSTALIVDISNYIFMKRKVDARSLMSTVMRNVLFKGNLDGDDVQSGDRQKSSCYVLARSRDICMVQDGRGRLLFMNTSSVPADFVYNPVLPAEVKAIYGTVKCVEALLDLVRGSQYRVSMKKLAPCGFGNGEKYITLPSYIDAPAIGEAMSDKRAVKELGRLYDDIRASLIKSGLDTAGLPDYILTNLFRHHSFSDVVILTPHPDVMAKTGISMQVLVDILSDEDVLSESDKEYYIDSVLSDTFSFRDDLVRDLASIMRRSDSGVFWFDLQYDFMRQWKSVSDAIAILAGGVPVERLNNGLIGVNLRNWVAPELIDTVEFMIAPSKFSDGISMCELADSVSESSILSAVVGKLVVLDHSAYRSLNQRFHLRLLNRAELCRKSDFARYSLFLLYEGSKKLPKAADTLVNQCLSGKPMSCSFKLVCGVEKCDTVIVVSDVFDKPEMKQFICSLLVVELFKRRIGIPLTDYSKFDITVKDRRMIIEYKV